jgi:hypothetical protein
MYASSSKYINSNSIHMCLAQFCLQMLQHIKNLIPEILFF